jgi:hypothetical protein
MSKPKLKFYDFGKKKAFETTDYVLKTKNGRNFAVAKTASGKDAYRIVSKIFMKDNK